MANKFIKEIIEPGNITGKSYWFIFQGDALLVEKQKDDRCDIPLLDSPAELKITLADKQYLGRYNDYRCYSAEVPGDVKPPRNMEFYTLRQLFYRMDNDLFWMGGYAFQIVQFMQTYQYCGRCGCKTERVETERAKICPECRLINYPRISPSMIVAVIKEDKILLARSTQFKSGFYSVLAGFVEPGETLEECVIREVKEETNIDVKNIRYFGSQPWPFPHSLMVGFIADYAGGELIIDKKEIVDAAWFPADNLPEIPGRISISRQLIDWFIENYKA
ncbi:MAG TPA: NAD(+) diphosphatase [Candidatus Deferrimicrobium sp.]|nr:NAD(+) diphosphatase [Candidatus Deferrimicrobium sp.]